MADQMLADFFTGQKLTQLAQAQSIKRGVANVMPEALLAPSPTKPMGTQVEYESIEGNRAVAQIVNSMSPSKRITLKGVSRKYATAVTSKEHVVYDQSFLMELKSDNPFRVEGAKRKIVQDMADFRSRFDALRGATVASAFAKGAIYFNSDGQVLVDSTGAVVTVNYGLDAVVDKNGALGDWSTNTTDIPGKLKAYRSTVLKANGFRLNNILYGESVLGYLLANTVIQALLTRNPAWSTQVMDRNEIPQGFLGFNWTPVNDAYFIDKDGTAQSWFGATSVVLYPDIDPIWYEFVEAGTLVPTGVASPNMTLDQMVELSQIINGYFSYAEMTTDPLAIKLIAGDGVLPVIKVPGVVKRFTVG